MTFSKVPRMSFQKLQWKCLQLFVTCCFLPSDFLPLKCDACEQLFCTDHIAYAHHNCTSAYKKVSKTGGAQIIPNLIEYSDSILHKAQKSRNPLFNGSCSFCNLSWSSIKKVVLFEMWLVITWNQHWFVQSKFSQVNWFFDW